MDLTLNVEDYKLNVRAAAIIIHNNKLLAHNDIVNKHYALLGGRVKAGEDSETAIKREIMEELGKEIDIIGYLTTIENFFELEGKKYHEIEFVYQAEFSDEKDKNIEYSLTNLEGEDWIKYDWLELEKIDTLPLKPYVFRQMLKENKFPMHRINNEMELNK